MYREDIGGLRPPGACIIEGSALVKQRGGFFLPTLKFFKV
jgi:hypothetical protein